MNYEIKDFSDKSVTRQEKPKKMKFRDSSFKIIYSAFTNFIKRKWANVVDKKLSEEKEKLVNMEFHKGDNIENIIGVTDKEKKIDKRVNKILRLSNILDFLTDKERFKANYKKAREEEDNRPLKLRSIMDKELRESVYGIEKIPELNKNAVAEKINAAIDGTKESIAEETKILNEKINDIKVEDNIKEEVQENFDNITVEDVKDAVDSEFKREEAKQEPEEKKNDDSITFEDVQNIVNGSFKEEEQKEVTPIENIAKKQFSNISLPTVDKDDKGLVVNEKAKAEETSTDKEEKVEREMPIVVPERKESVDLEKLKENIIESKKASDLLGETSVDDSEKRDTLTKKIIELDKEIAESESNLTEEEIANLKEEVRKSLNNDEEEKTEEPVEEKAEEKIEEPAEEKTEEKVEEKTEEKKKIPEEENIGFDFSDASIEDIKKAAEVSKSTKDLTAMINKIKVLRKEEMRTQEQINRAREEEERKEIEFQDTVKKLTEYTDGLEKKCNENIKISSEIQNKVKEKDEVINSMLKAMENPIEDFNQKKK